MIIRPFRKAVFCRASFPLRYPINSFSISNQEKSKQSYIQKEYKQYLVTNSSQHDFLKELSQHPQSWTDLKDSRKIEQLSVFLNQMKFESNKSKLCELLIAVLGYPEREAAKEVEFAIEIMEYQLRDPYPKRFVLSQMNPSLPKESGFYELKPYGVVLVVFDDKVTLFSIAKYWVVSMLSGNKLILSPSKLSEPIVGFFLSIWRKTQSQESSSMVACLEGVNSQQSNPALEKLLENMSVGFVSYTGSTSRGQRLYQKMASKSECFAESEFLLDSNNSCFIADDVESEQKLSKVTRMIVTAAFCGGGQNLNSIKRLFCSRKVMQRIKPLLIELTKEEFLEEVKPANPESTQNRIKPLCQEDAQEMHEVFKNIEKYPQHFSKLLGGKQIGSFSSATESQTLSAFQPTVVEILTQYPEFTFHSKSLPGPILFLCCVESLSQAVQRINESVYGVSATIFTEDQNLISEISEIGAKIEVGTVNLNTCELRPDVPLAVRKRSGKGYSNSKWAFENITRTKTVTF